jgi:hypothetical protein
MFARRGRRPAQTDGTGPRQSSSLGCETRNLLRPEACSGSFRACRVQRSPRVATHLRYAPNSTPGVENLWSDIGRYQTLEPLCGAEDVYQTEAVLLANAYRERYSQTLHQGSSEAEATQPLWKK